MATVVEFLDMLRVLLAYLLKSAGFTNTISDHIMSQILSLKVADSEIWVRSGLKNSRTSFTLVVTFIYFS